MSVKLTISFWLIFFSFIDTSKGVSYNKPKFCSNATWNATATTFADSSVVGGFPHGIFIDKNNSIYVGSWYDNKVTIWFRGSSTVTTTISSDSPYSLFVTDNGNIYIDNGENNRRVDRWTGINATSGVSVMNVTSACHALFIDANNSIYCVLTDYHQVIKRSLNTNGSASVTVAGTAGSSGSTSTLLNNPWGIFVSESFVLYVADSSNNRIQRFQIGNLTGTTVAGNTAPINFTLQTPTGIALDADDYLFILDTDNYRIIASSSTGFRCIAGCSAQSGSDATHLNHPRYIAFDPFGNILVTDDDNHRVQKFTLASNSCASTTTTTITTTTTVTTTSTTTITTTSTTTKTTSTTTTTTTTITSTTTITTTITTTTVTTTSTTITTTSTTITTTTSTITTTSTTVTTTTTTSTTTTVTTTSTTITTTTTTMTTTSTTITTSITTTTTTSTSSTTTSITASSTVTTTTGLGTTTNTASVSSNYTNDFVDYGRYKISNNTMDFDNALALCRLMNMTLLEIKSARKHADLLSITVYTNGNFYIGIDGSCVTSNYTTWLSGAAVEYSNWNIGEPALCTSSRQCVMSGNSSNSNQWHVVPCSNSLRFICEPYVTYSYALSRSALSTSDSIRSLSIMKTNQQFTLFEQIITFSSTLTKCTSQCMMNVNCIAFDFVNGNCYLATN